jgi:hypothetical protein
MAVKNAQCIPKALRDVVGGDFPRFMAREAHTRIPRKPSPDKP